MYDDNDELNEIYDNSSIEKFDLDGDVEIISEEDDYNDIEDVEILTSDEAEDIIGGGEDNTRQTLKKGSLSTSFRVYLTSSVKNVKYSVIKRVAGVSVKLTKGSQLWKLKVTRSRASIRGTVRVRVSGNYYPEPRRCMRVNDVYTIILK